MGSRGPIYTLVAAAQLMGENAELIEEVTANSANVDTASSSTSTTDPRTGSPA
jgi:hypothetical protein